MVVLPGTEASLEDRESRSIAFFQQVTPLPGTACRKIAPRSHLINVPGVPNRTPFKGLRPNVYGGLSGMAGTVAQYSQLYCWTRDVLQRGAMFSRRHSVSGKTGSLMATRSGDQGFQKGALDYATYLVTAEGRLGTDLVFANLQPVLRPSQTEKPHAQDVGSGTGAVAARLAQLGFHVTQLDSSEEMLDIARRTVDEAGVMDRTTFMHGDAGQLTDLFGATAFDVILCHNLLEYVDEQLSYCQVRLARNQAIRRYYRRLCAIRWEKSSRLRSMGAM